ncbi:Lrp/AsnC family leucine-responsive transcriptional regulator [Salibacterium salarium]|uniref:Lrp/AsnC family transcriptional regulator n=1 Tax=Salibacterium salarium TaxID=284579 RepID=UPI002781A29C|nr:Lrp/AsnC family transcriptional regulator [Salibacterium salarium]MDQ0300304.1 Lrp/AsnC family leucine-responsive transcriptional regulator [Salibacterium salarium]
MKELGEKVHLTGPATSARVAKLEENGVIQGYTIKVNQEKMGYSIHAIIQIYIKDTNHKPYLSFLKKQKDFVINNYIVSGESCYLLEGKFPSNEKLEEFLEGLSKYVSYKLSIVINNK